MTSGQLLLLLLLAAGLSAVAGAISALRMAGADLGKELAASMGLLFGLLVVVPAVLLGLCLLAWLSGAMG